MGGHGLLSTVPDYLRFIRMWLNDGASGSGEQVLRPETVEFAITNKLDELKVKMLPGVIPALSNDAEFFPGMPKSWAYTFMINDEDAPTGRARRQPGLGRPGQPLLLDRPSQRHRRILGHPNIPLRRPRIRRRLPRDGNRRVPRHKQLTLLCGSLGLEATAANETRGFTAVKSDLGPLYSCPIAGQRRAPKWAARESAAPPLQNSTRRNPGSGRRRHIGQAMPASNSPPPCG